MRKWGIHTQKGAVLIITVVFGVSFTMILGGLVGFMTMQNRSATQEVFRNQALEVAEAGLNKARWVLAHDSDYYNITTTIDGVYDDPQGGPLGQYHVSITPPAACEATVQIQSTGWTIADPDVKRSVLTANGRPSLGQYSFLTNSNIWFGGGTWYGPIHSNGGVRMDANSNALVTSAKDQYKCGTEHGCANPWQWKNGVWGTGNGGTLGLWQYPVTPIDFDAITVDLTELQQIASASGIYLGNSNAYGWHVRFNSNGTVSIYKVTQKKPAQYGYNGQNWTHESNSIQTETLYQTKTLPASCGNGNLIFSEENLWVDGVASRSAMVIAADFPYTASNNASIIINGNLTYATSSGAKVALVAQQDVRIPLHSPNVLTLDPVLFAQKGRFIRYFYCPPGYYSNPGQNNAFCVPNGSWAIRSQLYLRGAIISNGIAATTWVNGSGQVVSGYVSGSTSYDASIIYNPPPFLPNLGESDQVSWEETNPS